MCMEGCEGYKPSRFSIEVNVVRGLQKLAVLWLHHGATPDSSVEVTVDLHCDRVYFNTLFGDI